MTVDNWARRRLGDLVFHRERKINDNSLLLLRQNKVMSCFDQLSDEE